MRKRQIKALAFSLANLLVLPVMGGGSVQAAAIQHTFAAQLEEVRTGHFNGTEYLTIQIASNVGPAACRGNVIKIDAGTFNSEDKQQAIETVALSAMLNEDEVLITIPLGFDDCLDGKPTLLDMHLIDD